VARLEADKNTNHKTLNTPPIKDKYREPGAEETTAIAF
jgi:hypothetical protein